MRFPGPRQLHPVALSVCLAVGAPTSAALAQQRDTTRADTTRRVPRLDSTRTTRLAPIVVSGSRISGVDERTPVQVDEIDLSAAPPGPAAASQLLGRLPGVSVSDDQGSRLQPELDVRGFSVSPVVGQPQGVSVFLDGVRINEPDAQEVNFDLIPMDAISHAELVRGRAPFSGRTASPARSCSLPSAVRPRHARARSSRAAHTATGEDA